MKPLAKNRLFAITGSGVAMEADVQDGKLFREREKVIYVRLKDLSILNAAASADSQEQWQVKLPKTENNAAKGSIRVRKIIPMVKSASGYEVVQHTEPQYVLTTKAEKDAEDRLEVPEPVTVNTFELFKLLASNGMLKHRYHFPVEGSELVFEVDMFLKEDGTYQEWAKIDLELKDIAVEIPSLPFEVEEQIFGDTEDDEEKKKISELYETIFLSPNVAKKALGEAIGQEGLTEIFGGILIAVGVATYAYEAWVKWFKKDTSAPGYRKEVQRAIYDLRQTYLNDGWLDKKKFKSGKINGGSFLKLIAIDGKVGAGVLQDLQGAVKLMAGLDAKVYPAYSEYLRDVEAAVQPLIEGVKKDDAWLESNAKEVWLKVDKDLKAIKHPMHKHWDSLPNHSNVPGGLSFSIKKDPKSEYAFGDQFEIQAKLPELDGQISVLSKEGVKKAALVIMSIYDLVSNDKARIFDKSFTPLYKLPCPQDSDWPSKQHHINDTFEEYIGDGPFYGAHLYEIGALTDQQYDPLYELEYQYEKVGHQIIEGLMMWIKASIE